MSGIFHRGHNIIRKKGFFCLLEGISSYFWRLFSCVFIFPVVLKRNIVNVDEVIDFVFSRLTSAIRPWQVRDEIVKLVKLVERLKPRVVLEIGTACGGSLYLLTRASDPRGTIISIDLPGGPFGGGYPNWMVPLFKSFARKKQKIYLIKANSYNINTLNAVEEILGGNAIDFLFIDGDHSYEGIKRDFEMYYPLIKSGGIIAIHDIVPHDKIHDPQGIIGIARFWNEVKDSYKNLEIVKDWGQGWAGIGVLYV